MDRRALVDMNRRQFMAAVAGGAAAAKAAPQVVAAVDFGASDYTSCLVHDYKSDVVKHLTPKGLQIELWKAYERVEKRIKADVTI